MRVDRHLKADYVRTPEVESRYEVGMIRQLVGGDA